MTSRLFLMLLVGFWLGAAPTSFADEADEKPEAVSEESGTPEAEEGAGTAESDHSAESHTGADHAAEHHSGAHSETGESKPDPLAMDVDLAIFTLIVFIALATLLRLVAWDPIMKALESREENIAGEIAAAEAKHEEAKALYAEHAAKVAAATDEVKAMMEEARRDAEATKASIIAEATAAQEAIKQRTVREVEQARDSAIKHLAEESATLAIDLAAKVVKQDISGERQGEIIREAIGRLATSDPSSN